MASVDSKTQEEIARFMDVYLEVKSNYVEPVEDSKLIEGAINGMLASLDPHSGYLDARGFSNLRTQTDGEYGGDRKSVVEGKSVSGRVEFGGDRAIKKKNTRIHLTIDDMK